MLLCITMGIVWADGTHDVRAWGKNLWHWILAFGWSHTNCHKAGAGLASPASPGMHHYRVRNMSGAEVYKTYLEAMRIFRAFQQVLKSGAS